MRYNNAATKTVLCTKKKESDFKMRKQFAKILITVTLTALCLACGCGKEDVKNSDNKTTGTPAPEADTTPTTEPQVLTDAHGNTEEQAKENDRLLYGE